MKIVKCQHCQSDLQIQDEWLGYETDCPVCSKRTRLELPTVQVTAITGASPAGKLKKIIFTAAMFAVVIIITIVCTLAFAGKENSGKSPAAEEAAPETVAAVEKTVPRLVPAVPAAKKNDPFDLKDFVSGIPQVTKPAKTFDIAEYIPHLNNDNNEQMQRRWYSLFSKFSTPVWKLAAEREMSIAVANGNCLDIAVLLQKGYDINGLYADTNGSEDYKSPVLGTLFRSNLELHKFIKTYIFLCENGVDLNVPVDRDRYPKDLLLYKCQHSNDPTLWKLIPYSLAYGMKIKKTRLPVIQNTKLKEYVIEAINTQHTKPALTVENRLNHCKKEFSEAKITLPPDIKLSGVLNPVLPGHLLVCNYETHNNRLYRRDLQELMKKGLDLNALLLCSSHMHGGGSNKRYHESIINFVSDKPDTLLFMLANNWRYGAEEYLKRISRHHDPEIILMFWECGMDITPQMLNEITDRQQWENLKKLYDHQQSKFGHSELNNRDENEWIKIDAANAVRKNNFEKLQQIAGSHHDLLNYSELFFLASKIRNSEKIMQFCLDKGADAVWKDRYNQSAIDNALKYRLFNNLVFLYKLGKYDVPMEKILNSVVSSCLSNSRKSDNIDRKIEFLDHCLQQDPEGFKKISQATGQRLFSQILRTFSWRHFQRRDDLKKIMNWLKTQGFRPAESDVNKYCSQRSMKPYAEYIRSLLEN